MVAQQTDLEISNLPSADLRRDSNGKYIVGTAIVTAGTAVIAYEKPSRADAVADVTSMVTSLGSIAAAALVVALVPTVIFFAMKIVRKVMA
jgi:hypothetical protein